MLSAEEKQLKQIETRLSEAEETDDEDLKRELRNDRDVVNARVRIEQEIQEISLARIEAAENKQQHEKQITDNTSAENATDTEDSVPEE